MLRRDGELVEELDEGLFGGRIKVGVEESGRRRSGEELVDEGKGWGVGGPLLLTYNHDDST